MASRVNGFGPHLVLRNNQDHETYQLGTIQQDFISDFGPAGIWPRFATTS